MYLFTLAVVGVISYTLGYWSGDIHGLQTARDILSSVKEGARKGRK